MSFSKSLRTKEALRIGAKKRNQDIEIYWSSGSYNRSPNAGNRFKPFFGCLEVGSNEDRDLIFYKICTIIQLQKNLETEGYSRHTSPFIQGNCVTKNIFIDPVSYFLVLEDKESDEWVLAKDKDIYYYSDGHPPECHAEPILNEDGTYKKFDLLFRFIGTKDLFKELISIDKKIARDLARTYFKQISFDSSGTILDFDSLLQSIDSFEELEQPLPPLTQEDIAAINTMLDKIY